MKSQKTDMILEFVLNEQSRIEIDEGPQKFSIT